jgi:hypothetical protein
MGLLSLALIVAGVVLIAVGAYRARDPYRRYMALREQDANIARYEAWRGGPRAESKTGASVAMDVLRRRAQIGAGIAIAGIVLVVVGFVVR